MRRLNKTKLKTHLEQFKEFGILRAESRTKREQFQVSLLVEIAWLSQHGFPWSKLHPPPSRHSGSVRTALSAAALYWLLDERSGNETTSPHNIIYGNPMDVSPSTISNCRPSSVLHRSRRFSTSLPQLLNFGTYNFPLCATT